MKFLGSVLFAMVALTAACGGDDDSGGDGDYAPVVTAYATNVYASYSDTLTTAKALKAAVDAFVASPSATTLEAAKTAWKAAREPYLQTEVYRFYDGPIDNAEDGPEGLINAWPLDEVFIEGAGTTGIINDTVGFPTLTKQLIAEQNEKGGEANISTGYHAIEFLLWGEDTSATGPGARPFTDFTTLANFERRKQYLALVAELLVDDLTQVTEQWAPGAANYRADFETGGKDSVQKILLGMGSLSGAELSGERMTVALDNRDQEDEHSCFSDNTHRDIIQDALGIQNVYLGKYGATDAVGIEDLVRAEDPALADKLKTQLVATAAACAAIPVPFDQAIQDEAGRAKVEAAVQALQTQTETTVEVATKLGITINLE